MTEHQFNNEIIDEEQLSNKYSSDRIISHSQLKNEAAYYWAQALSKSLLEAGYLTKNQYLELTILNRQTYSPLLAKIMPNTVDM